MSRFDRVADPVVARWLGLAEDRLAGLVRETAAGRERHRQVLSRRAKRLRPALLLTAARFGVVHREDHLIDAAVALELLHEATLHHDDVVDAAPTRRGAPTTQAAFGARAAAFAGSELLFRATALLADLPPVDRRSVARAIDAVCRGQLREVELLGDPAIGLRTRVRVMRDKTARLFALAARLGASLASCDERVVRTLARFGLGLGLCFQLADDLRDLDGAGAALGRSPGCDLLDGVYTLPVLYGVAAGGGRSAELLRRVSRAMATRDAVELQACIGLVHETGGWAAALADLRRWQVATLRHLPTASGGQEASVAFLRDLVAAIVTLPADTPQTARPVAAA